MPGVTTANVQSVSFADELICNREGSTRKIPLERVAALLAAMIGPTHATRAELFADLNWPAGAVGYVRADSDSAFNGVYKKAGPSGSGSWSRIGDLPTGAIETALIDALADEITALEAVVAGKADTASLAAGLTAEADARVAGDAAGADLTRAALDLAIAEARPDAALSDDVIWAVPGETAGPAVTRSGDLYARQPLHMGEPVLSDRYKSILAADETGNPLIAVDTDDTLRLALLSRVLSDRWCHAELSEDGHILRAWTIDGEPLAGPLPVDDWRVEIRGDDGAAHVHIAAPGRPELRVTVEPGTYRGALIRGAWLSWLAMQDGVGHLRRLQLAGAYFDAGITEVRYYCGYGQSLARGTGSTPVQTVTPPMPGRLLAWPVGVYAGMADVAIAISESDLADLNDAAPISLESPIMQASAVALAAAGLDVGGITASHAIGGRAYVSLKSGTIPYGNILTSIARAAFFCGVGGQVLRVPAMVWTHGEANRANNAATYQSYMEELAADFAADVAAITGQPSAPVLLIDQMSNWTAYNDLTTSGVPMGQLQAALDNPGAIECLGPKYMMATYDGLHLRGPMSANLGARQGRALAQIDAGTWTGPLYMLSALRTGASVVLSFNRPFGGADLDLHTGLVTDPGNYGLSWLDAGDGNAVTITAVAVSGPMQITVTLSAAPTGTAPRIGIAVSGTMGAFAGPTTGPRSCIRSASTDTDLNGAAMDHYACHQIITVET